MFIFERKNHKGKIFEVQYLVTSLEGFHAIKMLCPSLKCYGCLEHPAVYRYFGYSSDGDFLRYEVYVPIPIQEEIIKEGLQEVLVSR